MLSLFNRKDKLVNEWSNILDGDLEEGMKINVNKIIKYINGIKYGPKLKKKFYKEIIYRLKEEIKNIS